MLSRTQLVKVFCFFFSEKKSFFLLLLPLPALAAPSFNCARATSTVTRLICATPELAALDSKLADDYAATSTQAGIDAKALRTSEDIWLSTTRAACTTVACLRQAYLARDAALLDSSLRAASPAAYADTRPFPTTPAASAAARAFVGHAAPIPPPTRIPATLPITGRNTIVEPWRIAGANFAVLLSCTSDSPTHCQVTDLVALPSDPALRFLQCHTEESQGFALRQPTGHTLAYWSVTQAAIRREPIHVLGEQSLRCQEPETGE